MSDDRANKSFDDRANKLSDDQANELSKKGDLEVGELREADLDKVSGGVKSWGVVVGTFAKET